MQVVNRTPYPVERVILFDRNGAETLVVSIKALYHFSQNAFRLADEQEPIALADEYFGDPGTSSIRRAAELLPPKKSTDILVTGHAFAPKAGTRTLDVGVRVGNVMHRAVVLGDRKGFQSLGKPQPFEKIALTWENAFGGSDITPDDESLHGYCAENPVGRGYMARGSRVPSNEVMLPNIEHVEQRLSSPGDAPPPAGFAPIAPSWRPRAGFAGTYDDDWVRNRAPLLPLDFDDRFLNVAPPALIAPDHLVGNEPCTLVGLVPEGRMSFQMQTMPPFVRAKFARKVSLSTPRLETFHLDSDRKEVALLWKSAINVNGRVEELREIEVRFDP